MTKPTEDPPRADLTNAVRVLATAAQQIAEFHLGLPSDGDEPSYAEHGHAAVSMLEALVRELHRQRQALVDELRADDEERATRIAEMVEAYRADHEADMPEVAP